ncbi:hypothetical protein [Chryseobacterium indologenes]|uniref:hypothetical protein n=1 Tax=Chryseobacterium indologenes TaxID=253 RepID=UPI0016267872|nr:hypothetical protein [Chryseobacterium indologenes]MDM1557510.1 hypothetical protein [Chryseobacterium indologenes]
MSKRNKFNERNSVANSRDSKNLELRNGKKEPFIVLSLRNRDRNQGESYEEWQEEEILALAMMKLQEVCNLTKIEATSRQIIKEYPKGVFPPNSDFTHPRHIPDDISWCSMHIQGKECIIGYFEENIFYIVFLDKDHRFWITQKKNT